MQLSEIITNETLLSQASKLCRRKFTPGYDHMTATAAYSWIQLNSAILQNEILAGQYQPLPALGYYVAKSSGKRRLARLTAIDSVLQLALLEHLAPICEDMFSAHSFAYRKGRGASSALEMYCTLGSKNKHAIKLDIRNCFDSIQHDILEKSLTMFFSDEKTRAFLMRMVKMPLCIDREITPPEQGIIQGAPLSPLLSNIYLHSLDMLLESEGVSFIRYADDIVLFAKDAEQLQQWADLAKDHLVSSLGLTTNTNKISITSPADLHFLGYEFQRDKRNNLIALSDEANQPTHHTWHTITPKQSSRSVEILSDGILRQKDFSLLFDNGEDEFDIPIATTPVINIYSNVIFDSGFLSRAMKKGMSINLFDQHDHLIGRITPERPLHAPKITLEQIETYCKEKKRLILAKQFVLAALHHQQLNIRYYHRHNHQKVFIEAINSIDTIESRIKKCSTINDLLLLEAQAKEEYYSCFDYFIKQAGFCFEHRSRRPPHNEINAMLSFGNMVLYSEIASLINRSPVDIRIGCVHATNRRSESLNLDFADVYKPLIVDRTVLTLINRRALRLHHFTSSEDGGIYLSSEGKRIFIAALYEKMANSIQINGKNMTYRSIISADIQAYVRFFRNGERYKPFRQVK